MLISAAVCPHPPVLVPEVAGAAAPELDGLRAACGEAVRRLVAPVAGVEVVIVGGAERTLRYPPESVATLRPYGVGNLSRGGEGPELPLSLSIGAWLLQGQAQRYQSVEFDASPEECAELGRELAASADRVALLVMGDGSACRSEKAPGYLDERAGPYDAAVAKALGHADAAALAGLDPQVYREIQAAGRAAWQVLGGAAQDGRFDAELLADEAPYGVGYLVASWIRAA